MKIRSITYFCNPGWPLQEGVLDAAGRFLSAARPALEAAGYEVQTGRLATVPFPRMAPKLTPEAGVELALGLQRAARERGYDYLSLGPALPDDPGSYALIPVMLAATENVFFGGVMAGPESGIALPAVRACAQVIAEVGALDPNGFGNLYFAALANVPPGSPFFPAAYHGGGGASFALATEAADLAVEAFRGADGPLQAQQRLTAAIERHAGTLAVVCRQLEERYQLPFGGLDFSLAPFPAASHSIGNALEALGVPAVGQHGTLAAAALVTQAVDRATFPRAGFSGLFTPVLEDSQLAARAAQGLLSVKDLLLYSAVCGTGLDTLPLPGDTSPEQLSALLLDVAALALRLGKPLTARLMPIPGKKAGEETQFTFDYFANSRILSLDAAPLGAALASEESIPLNRAGA
jgi:uncharacterized protein (UPF0210 family)